MLMYDVPAGADIEHPSIWMRGVGIRIQLSVWMLFEDDIPHARLSEIARAGVTWDVVPFDVKANKQLLDMAIRNLKQDIKDTVTSATQSARSAQLRLRHSLKPALVTAKKYKNDITRITKTMGATLNQYRSVAKRFGLQGDAIGIPSAMEALGSLRTAVLTRSREFLRVAAEIEVREPNSPMAKAARQGRVPGWALADYGMDMGVMAHPRKLFEMGMDD